MAQSRIKGIAIELSGDSTKLSECLRGVEKQIRDTQSALKDVNGLLKMDPGNTDLLTQKQKYLTDEWLVEENAHEAIVSRDTFEKVRKILKEKGDNFHKGKIEAPKKEDKYHGLLFCGCCGRKMRRDSRMNHPYGVEKGAPHRVYNYLCVSTNDPAHDGIGGFAIMERKLDRIVFAVLKAQIVALTSKAEIDSFGAAIVSKDDFDAVQAILDSQPKLERLNAPHCLKSKVFCGECGFPMRHLWTRTAGYACEHTYFDRDQVHKRNFITDEEMEKAVLEGLKKEAEVMADASVVWKERRRWSGTGDDEGQSL